MKNILITLLIIVAGMGGAKIFSAESAGHTSFNVLVLTERGGQHGGFTDAGLKWLKEQAEALNFELTEINNTEPINDT
ncbi:MAG: hypothetical protein LBB84_13105, partial [Tannerellaceae bacterium]|nr:hypothetical protein [Tannerellaceae bacterium]